MKKYLLIFSFCFINCWTYNTYKFSEITIHPVCLGLEEKKKVVLVVNYDIYRNGELGKYANLFSKMHNSNFFKEIKELIEDTGYFVVIGSDPSTKDYDFKIEARYYENAEGGYREVNFFGFSQTRASTKVGGTRSVNIRIEDEEGKEIIHSEKYDKYGLINPILFNLAFLIELPPAIARERINIANMKKAAVYEVVTELKNKNLVP
ncbi:hypothetical protein DLM76_20360 [Leptospira yasudae]|uniref:hypothetical protein n=1 Tax=Leptospira yasudae TaxID=2202201 RepID=UPI000E59AD67|nr:hypothetical protein [Leptospira yasudae]RHX90221.1 hypothetical protein DLM76_20360 [Leptospira yasudae]